MEQFSLTFIRPNSLFKFHKLTSVFGFILRELYGYCYSSRDQKIPPIVCHLSFPKLKNVLFVFDKTQAKVF